MVSAMAGRPQALLALRLLFGALALVLGAVPSAAALRDKTDVLVCGNGDVLACEIKELDLGKLRVKTSTMSTVYVKWEHVTSLTSAFGYAVETNEGHRYAGSFVKNDRPRILSIYTRDGQIDVHMDDITRIDPLGQTFFERLDGHLDLGFNYTKSTDITQLYTSFSSKYRREKYIVNVGVETNVTSSGNEDIKRRWDGNGSYRWLYPDRYYANYTLGAQRNDELGINLRSYATATLGRYFAQSSHHEFSGAMGLSGNQENTADAGTRENVEGVFSLDYAFIRFKEPEANIATTFTWYPSLTNSGRNRVEYDVRLKYEIVDDFFWSLSVYYSYDSRPPDGASGKDDYGIVNSIGYSW